MTLRLVPAWRSLLRCVLTGIKYRFCNGVRDGWMGRGPQRAVVLTPTALKLDDSEELLQEQAELQHQLTKNEHLSKRDRELLSARLAKIEAKLVAAC